MSKSNDEALNRLFATLNEKGEALSEMTKLVEELERGGIMTVTGEAVTARLLKERHSAATEILEHLKSNNREDVFRRVEEELGSTDWAALPVLLEELKKKVEAQSKFIASHLERLREAPSLIANLRSLLNEALAAHAQVVDEQKQVQKWDASLDQAERFQREQHYRLMIDALDQVAQRPELDKTVQDVQYKIKWITNYSRQADLLLLQSPLDQQRRYTYTMLLRTASEPGSHGINIQDTSTVVEQDRNAMMEMIDSVTRAIDRGLAREFTVRKASAPPPPDEILSATEPAPVAGPAQDPVRHLGLRGDGDVETPLKVNALLEQLGDLMFRLFLPEWMQRYLEETDCSVMISSNDLELPWELMHYHGEFLCLDRPTSRMPMGRGLPRHKELARHDRAKTIRFLLIYSDPKGTLPAAEKEIDVLETQLGEEWKGRIEVVKLKSADASGGRLNRELRRGNFDVIHYAGHASFDQEKPDLSGLQVSDGQTGQEVYFAQKIRRLLEGRPLVFLNACDSARVANQQEASHTDFLLKPAGGLASAFLYGGALACVGSIWPIYDTPAADFAREFYNEALRGSMLGEAMRIARTKIRKKYPDQVTWAAFALYGDPTFRLGS